MSSYQESAASAPNVLSEIDRLERELAQSQSYRNELADQFSALRLDHELLRKVSAEKLARMQAEVERLMAALSAVRGLHPPSCACPHQCAFLDSVIGGEP